MNECKSDVFETMLEGKDEMKEKINQIPHSAARRTEILAEDSLQQLLDDIKKAPFISLAMDESTGMTIHDREGERVSV